VNRELGVPKGLRRIRGVLVIGVLWGAGWAIVGGGVMEGFVDPQGRILDMWPQTLGIVGFLGGVIFSLMVRIAGERRSFSEFSFVEFAGLGAAAGLVQGVLAMAIMGAPALFTGLTIVVSAGAALGSLAVARMARTRSPLESTEEILLIHFPDANAERRHTSRK